MDARSNDADVISLGRAASTPGNDQLDSAGQTILQLIHKAAGFAEETADKRWKWRRPCQIS